MQPETHTATIPFIPENAPFSQEQRSFLNGLLAGLFSGAEGPSAPSTPISIFWGSQTGTSETLARKTAKQLKKNGFEPKIVDLGELEGSALGEEELAIIITSTYGDGEPPDNAKTFYDYLHSDDALELSKVNYAVLALGDTNYEKFCKAGVDIDERMKYLGAKRLIDRVDCDTDYDDAFDGWLSALQESLTPFKAEGAAGTDEEDEEEEPKFNKKNPYTAKVTVCEKLNGADSAKDVRHITFDLGDSGLNYQAGDAIGVYPINCESLVDTILERTTLDADELVHHAGVDMTLKQALMEKFDINKLSRPVLAAYQHLVDSAELAELLLDDNKEQFSNYINSNHFIDLIEEFSHDFTSGDELLKLLPLLQPRLYSISSSPKVNPKEVSVTVGTIRYEMKGRSRKGVASTFLADRLPEDKAVNVFFHHNNKFRLPEDDDLPVIMVGPGTGIAPFRAFLQEREAREAAGDNWLFFGDQHSKTDFLYSDLLGSWQKKGLLNRLSTAFSRDQKEKIYVQTRMIEEAEALFEWLEKGAYFYVCGDASRMAKDVDDALHKVIETCGNLSTEEAAEYVNRLKKEKRYQRDVY